MNNVYLNTILIIWMINWHDHNIIFQLSNVTLCLTGYFTSLLLQLEICWVWLDRKSHWGIRMSVWLSLFVCMYVCDYYTLCACYVQRKQANMKVIVPWVWKSECSYSCGVDFKLVALDKEERIFIYKHSNLSFSPLDARTKRDQSVINRSNVFNTNAVICCLIYSQLAKLSLKRK